MVIKVLVRIRKEKNDTKDSDIEKNWQWKNAFYILSLSVNEKLEEILGSVMDAFTNMILFC